MSHPAEAAALARVPDVPRCVDTRGMLLTRRVPDFRGRGLAGRAARAMIRHMRGFGRAPVWGALETNAASLSVARQLGFQPAGRLAVFTSR